MAFDETLAQRIRDALARKKSVEERKMFGCLCFMLDGNALVGVTQANNGGANLEGIGCSPFLQGQSGSAYGYWPGPRV